MSSKIMCATNNTVLRDVDAKKGHKFRKAPKQRFYIDVYIRHQVQNKMLMSVTHFDYFAL